MSGQSSTSKMILALLAGAAIGAGAALLLTPNDGKTNRKKLKEKVDELSEEFCDSLQEKAEKIIDDIEEEIEDIAGETEEKTV